MGDLEEINDFPRAESVDEVTGGPAEHEGEAEAHDGVREAGVEEIDDDGANAEKTGYDEEGAGVLEDAESRASVREMDEAYWPVLRPGASGVEGAADEPLGELIEGDNTSDHDEEPGIAKGERASTTGRMRLNFHVVPC